MKVNGTKSRDRSREQIDPQATTKTSKLNQVNGTNKNTRQTSITKSQQTILAKKDSYERNAPPVPPLPPKIKVTIFTIQVKEEDLMTQSRIVEARNGLQLLKKKISQRAISKDRIQPRIAEEQEVQQVRPKNTPPPLGRRSSKDVQEQSEPPSQKVLRKPPLGDKPKLPQPKYSPPSQVNEYLNPNEQIRIQPKNVDFQRMIEEQLRKEKKGGNTNKVAQKYSHANQFEQEVVLVECSQGCGRKFKEDALEKHERVCRKVFQDKRKVFDSAAMRKPEEEGIIPQYEKKDTKKPSKITTTSKISKAPTQQKPGSQIPKWKLQSAAFRAGIKRAANRPLSKQQLQVADQEKNLLVLCNSCGRRFNKNAAERHIPFCEEKNKKIPARTTMNSTFQGKKRK